MFMYVSRTIVYTVYESRTIVHTVYESRTIVYTNYSAYFGCVSTPAQEWREIALQTPRIDF